MKNITKAFPGARAVNVLRVASAVADTETITIGSDVYEVDVGDGITAGRILVDLSAGGTKAVGTLTSDTTAPSDGDTVTAGTKVYTFKTALTPTEGEVLIGGSAAIALDNLKLAINRTSPSTNDGVNYKIAAANTSVTATTNTDTTQVVQAIYTGLGGNAIATTETSSHLSWGAATLASAADPTAAQFITALVNAINVVSGQSNYGAVAVSTTGVCIFSVNAGTYTTACTETLAGSNNVWAAAAMYGGEGNDVKASWRSQRVPNATEVTLGFMQFAFPFTPTKVGVQVKVTSSGAVYAWDGNATITGNVVTLDNAGSTDWAATSTVTVTASE